MRRCFSFGCSFTHWFYWPTWADFIGINYDQYYNFAMPGSSNRTIHNRLIEANDFYNFTEDDLVLVGITNFGRLNWLEEVEGKRSWCCHGGPDNWPKNDKTSFLKQYFWKQDYGIYDTWLMVKNTACLFNATGVKVKFVMSLDNRHFTNLDYLSLTDKELAMAEDIYNICVSRDSIQEFSSDNAHHPNPIEHYNYAVKHLPYLITDKSKLYLDEVVSNINFSCDGIQSAIYGKIRSKFTNHLSPLEFPMYGKYH